VREGPREAFLATSGELPAAVEELIRDPDAWAAR
jgi:hypothetical protein